MSRLADLLGEASDALGPDGATPSMADLDFIADALAECRDLAAAAEARVVALEEALPQLIMVAVAEGYEDDPDYPEVTQAIIAARAVLASSVKQEKEGLGGSRYRVCRSGGGTNVSGGDWLESEDGKVAHAKLLDAYRAVEAMRVDDPFASRGMVRLGRALVAFHEPLLADHDDTVSATDELGSSPEKGSALSRAQEDHP